MSKTTFPIVIILLTFVVAGCSSGEQAASKQIQQRQAGDYVITVLNESGELQTGANDLTLEFKKSGSNELVDVGTVQVESTMTMPGMGPMMGSTNVTPSGTPGRYNVTADLSMMGDWKVVVRFADGQQAQFNLSAQ